MHESSFESFGAVDSASVEGPTANWSDINRILVMRLDNIGDVILLSPAVRTLREQLPHAHISLLASPAGAQAAPLLPWLDQIVVSRVLWQDLGRLDFDPGRELQLAEILRAGSFDLAITFTSFSQSPHPAAFLCRNAGVPFFAGQSKEAGGVEPIFPSAPPPLHQAERNLYLLECLGLAVEDRTVSICIPDDAQHWVDRELERIGLTPEAGYLLFNPWASCPARTFPADRLAESALAVAERTGLPVLVTGLEKDRPSAQSALRILGSFGIDLIGRTDLVQFAALVARARLVLTSNTSALHLADATRTPVVVLYSGTDLVSQWEPRFAAARILRRDTACTPCYGFTCPFRLECLDVPKSEIVKAALELLQ